MQYTQPFDQIDPNAPYVNGNPATGTQGSIIPAGAIEQDQRELVNAILGAGITPSGSDLTQLYKALLLSGYCVAGGTGNAITVTMPVTPGAYAAGQMLRVKITASNTGPVTINVNGLGAKAITSRTGSALASGDLPSGAIALLQYDGTNFQLSGTGGGGSGVYYGNDTGTANAINTTIVNAPTSLAAGMAFFIKKAASANTGAMTVQINSLGPYTLLNTDGSAMANAQMAANYFMYLAFDGTSFRFMNGATTTAVGSLTANAGEGINVNGSAVVSLNFPSLSAPSAPVGSTDLFPMQSIVDGHARVLTLAQLTTAFPAALVNVSTVSATGTFTKNAKTRSILAIAAGAGGGGGGQSGPDYVAAAGGGSGETAWAFIADATAISTVSCTIGTGGLGGLAPGNTGSANGTDGSDTSFGVYAIGKGGKGGQGNAGTSTQTSGGLGGDGGTGLFKMRGNPGINGSAQSGGSGGASFFGGAGLGIAKRADAAAGNGYGWPGAMGGGGGAADNQGSTAAVGGAGGNGFILVLEFA